MKKFLLSQLIGFPIFWLSAWSIYTVINDIVHMIFGKDITFTAAVIGGAGAILIANAITNKLTGEDFL